MIPIDMFVEHSDGVSEEEEEKNRPTFANTKRQTRIQYIDSKRRKFSDR